jgi:hypothetical protein
MPAPDLEGMRAMLESDLWAEMSPQERFEAWGDLGLFSQPSEVPVSPHS